MQLLRPCLGFLYPIPILVLEFRLWLHGQLKLLASVHPWRHQTWAPAIHMGDWLGLVWILESHFDSSLAIVGLCGGTNSWELCLLCLKHVCIIFFLQKWNSFKCIACFDSRNRDSVGLVYLHVVTAELMLLHSHGVLNICSHEPQPSVMQPLTRPQMEFTILPSDRL